jgi:hypothetical protein
MSIPTAVFLDTSILDAQQYNFRSTALSTFVPACLARSVRLLMPDPTEREIKRHIRERSLQALEALESARRKAPFLAKWPRLQQAAGRSAKVEEFEVHRIASQQWTEFLKQFNVVRLGYDGLNVATVMGWYDRADAPFREGKKRKEFPDAFAIAMLEAYSQKEKCYVAVVSADQGFEQACQRFSSLLHFHSLPSLTEVLLSDDVRMDRLRQAIVEKIGMIEEAVYEETSGLSFFHVNDRLEIHGVDYEGFNISEHSIVAVGDRECTITFAGVLAVKLEVRWEDYGEKDYETVQSYVEDSVEVSGSAKVAFDESATKVVKVTMTAFEESDLPITEAPEEFQ